MKSLDLSDGDTCITLGYYSVNDGGGAIYKIRTKSDEDVEDNGSIHFLQNNLVAELVIDTSVNVKQFGAKGDNVTNNTTFIQNAMNFANNNKIEMIIPSGIFRVETIKINSNTKITGTEKDKSILKRISSFNTDNYPNFYRHGYILGFYSSNTRIYNVHLKDFTIDGVREDLSYTNETLQRNAITNNIYIKLCDNVKIENVHSINSSKSGVNLVGCNDIKIEDSEFNNCGNSISSMDKNGISIKGLYYDDDTQTTINYLSKNVQLKNNYSHNNTDAGIMYTYCKDITISNNRCIENGDRGIEGDSASLNADELNVTITDNMIFDNINAGITEYGKAQRMNYICKSNILKNISTTGIAVGIDNTDIANIDVSNNIIDGCEGNSINLVGSIVKFNNNIIKNAKGTITLNGIKSLEWGGNTIYSDEIITKSIYSKSNNEINIFNNSINNYLYNIMIQNSNSESTNINNVNISNNSVTNLTNLINIQTDIKNLMVNGNVCDDTRDTIAFETILKIGTNYTVENCNLNTNIDTKAKYGMSVTNITNLFKNANTKDYLNHFKNTYSKPTANNIYHKKGDIAFSSNIAFGLPIGWVYNGIEWLPFGIIQQEENHE